MSLRANSGSRQFSYSSIAASRPLAASSAPQIWHRNGTAAPGDQTPSEEANPLSTHVSHSAVDGEQRPAESGPANHFLAVVLSCAWQNAHTFDVIRFFAPTPQSLSVLTYATRNALWIAERRLRSSRKMGDSILHGSDSHRIPGVRAKLNDLRIHKTVSSSLGYQMTNYF